MKNIKSEKDLQTNLKRLRKKIDRADRALFQALSLRTKAVTEIGHLKRRHGLPVLQKARWKEVMRERVKIAKGLGISEAFVKRVLTLIHKESIRIQTRPRNGKKS
jgi:chorismate mutase